MPSAFLGEEMYFVCYFVCFHFIEWIAMWFPSLSSIIVKLPWPSGISVFGFITVAPISFAFSSSFLQSSDGDVK